MALHMDRDGKVRIITPPKNLTTKERKILEEAPVDTKILSKAKKIEFNVVYG